MPVNSLSNIQCECRLLIVSANKKFKGITGIENLSTRPNIDQIIPKSKTWVNRAADKWIKSNTFEPDASTENTSELRIYIYD